MPSSSTAGVRTLYVSLARSADLGATTQRRLLDYALRHGDLDLCTALLRVVSLDTRVDDELRQVTHPTVRTAWIARPGRRPDQILPLLGSHRAGPVARAAAAVTNLPEAVYFSLLESGSKQLWPILLANLSIPLAVRRQAAVYYGRDLGSARFNTAAVLDSLFAPQMPLVADLISETTSPHTLAWAAQQRFVGDHAALGRVVTDQVIPRLSGRADTDWARTATLLSIHPSVTDEQKNLLCVPSSGSAAESPPLREPVDVPLRRWLQRLGHAQLAESVQATLSLNHPEMAALLLAHPDLLPEQARLLAALVSVPVATAAARRLGHNAALFAAVCVNAGVKVTDELLAGCLHPTKALPAVVLEYRRQQRNVDSTLHDSRYLIAEAVIDFPLSFLSASPSPVVASALEQLLPQALTTDSSWVRFESQGADFDAPLSNLLLASGFNPWRNETGTAPVALPGSVSTAECDSLF